MSNKIKRVRLRDVIAESEVVPIGVDADGEVIGIQMFGIGLADILSLFRVHTLAMEEVFREFMKRQKDGEDFTIDGMTVLFNQVLSRAPHLLHDLIAASARDLDAREQVADLRAPVQLALLQAVIRLSIKSETELKKLAADLDQQIRFLATAAAEVGQSRLSGAGFGASASA